MKLLNWLRVWSYWSGSGYEVTEVAQHKKLLKWLRIWSYWADSGYEVTEQTQDMKSLNWFSIWSYWSGSAYEVAELAQDMKLLNWLRKCRCLWWRRWTSELDNVRKFLGRVHNHLTLEDPSLGVNLCLWSMYGLRVRTFMSIVLTSLIN